MSFFEDLMHQALPILFEWDHLSPGRKTGEVVKIALGLGGLWEVIKFVDRRLFKRRSRLEQKLEFLEEEVAEQKREIKDLESELGSAREKLLDTAIKKSEREWRDRNEDSAIRVLENWLQTNSEPIGALALNIAKYHISRSIPNPTDHIQRANMMLRLARILRSDDQEVRELQLEFDVVNAALQEQLISTGDTQIAWNDGMAAGLQKRGEARIPIIETLRSVASFCLVQGHYRMACLFGDRAASLANSAGERIRLLWFLAETEAAFYSDFIDRGADALIRLDRALAEANPFLGERDINILRAKYYRARVLNGLGCEKEALEQIDVFGPIQLEVLGARNPGVLSTKYLRALVLTNLGRYAEALLEIDTYHPVQVEVLGSRDSNVWVTQQLRASVLNSMGRHQDALREVEAYKSIEAKSLGPNHPFALSTSFKHAEILADLGRDVEALSEIDSFQPLQVQALGANHSNVLVTRRLRAKVFINLARNAEALHELDSLRSVEEDIIGSRHPNIFWSRYLRATALRLLGRQREALAEVDDFAPVQAEVLGQSHPAVLDTHHLRNLIIAAIETPHQDS